MPTQDEVLMTREGPVFTLTFNRPDARNAMTWHMYDRLDQACEEVDGDDSARYKCRNSRPDPAVG